VTLDVDSIFPLFCENQLKILTDFVHKASAFKG